MRPRHALLLAAVLLAVLLVVAWARQPRPVALAVDGPPPTSAAELVAGADLVVVGRVGDVVDGRLVAGDGAAGVRTQLVELLVDDVVVGEAGPTVVVEEVVALADGTPATMGGMAPSRSGDAGLWLLVRGDGTAFTATAPAGPHGRFLLDDDSLVPAVDDELGRRLAALGPSGLRTRLRALGGQRG